MRKIALFAMLVCAVAGYAQTEERDWANMPLEEMITMAEAGDAEAQFALGGRYVDGVGVEKSAAEAVKWWTRAAEQGYAYAQNDLGGLYYSGLGVEKSKEEACKWWTLAAKQGNEVATMNLNLLNGDEDSEEEVFQIHQYIIGGKQL